MLSGINVSLSTDFHSNQDNVKWNRQLIYTGPIDRFFNYQLGRLPYRTQIRTELFLAGQKYVFPCGQVNLPSPSEGRHVRTIEWRHMLEPGEGPDGGTLLTVETPVDARDWMEAEYPFPSKAAREHYDRYTVLAAEMPDVLFCGRLGEYRYLDMDQAIGRAMMLANRLLESVAS